MLELEDVLQFELDREHVTAPPPHHQPGPTHRDVPPVALHACHSRPQWPVLRQIWAIVPSPAPVVPQPSRTTLQAVAASKLGAGSGILGGNAWGLAEEHRGEVGRRRGSVVPRDRSDPA